MEQLPAKWQSGDLAKKAAEYLELQDEIRAVIKSETTDKPDEELVDDIVSSIGELAKNPGWSGITQFIANLFTGKSRRKKLAKIIRNILGKIFDISTERWYAVDYKDLKETCDRFGGMNYFKKEDHRRIYTIIIQVLKHGPIRDKCIEIGATKFLNEKLEAVEDNFTQFKIKEY